MANVEKTFVLVKPDGVKNTFAVAISRFERKGLILHSVKMIQVPEELAKTLSGIMQEKAFSMI